MSIARLLIQFSADTKGIFSGIAQIEGQINKFGKGLGSLGKFAVGGLTAAAIADIGKQALVMSAKFETAFLKIKNLTDSSAGDLNVYKSKVKEISSKTGQSVLDLAQGLFSVTSAGLTGKAALETLNIAARGAALGMGSTNDIARALTGTLNAYGPANLTAARAAEILFKTTKQGAIDIDELTGSLSNVTPLAAQMGVKLEEVGAFLATVSLNGTSASEGVTQLRSVLDAIINPSSEASKILKAMGISITDLQDVIKNQGLRQGLLLLKEGFKGNNEAMAKFFGRKEAVIGFLSALGTNAQRYGDILNENNKLTDQFGSASDESLNSLENRWSKLTSTVQNYGLSLGNFFKVVLLKVADSFTDSETKFKRLKTELDGFRDQAIQIAQPTIDAIRASAGIVTKLSTGGPKPGGNILGGGNLNPEKQKESTLLSELTTKREKLIDVILRAKNANKDYSQALKDLSIVETKINGLESFRNDVIEQLTTPFNAAIEQIKRQTDRPLLEDFMSLQDLKRASDYTKVFQALSKSLNDVRFKDAVRFQNAGTAGGLLVNPLPSAGDNSNRLLNGKLPGASPADIEKQIEAYKALNQQYIDNTKGATFLNLSMEATARIGAGIGDTLANAFSGFAGDLLEGANAFKALGNAAIEAARGILKAILAEVVATAISKAIKNSPNILLGIGVAAAAALAVLSLFKSKVPKLAKGGGAFRPTLAVIGDNPGAGSDPELVLPESRIASVVNKSMNNLLRSLSASLNAVLKDISIPSAQSLKIDLPSFSSLTSFASPDIRPSSALSFDPIPLDVAITGKIQGNDLVLINDRLTSFNNKAKGRKYNSF